MKYTTLLFDADNTLLDFDTNEAFSFRAMLKELGETYTEELFQTYRRLNSELWKRIERQEIEAEEGVNRRFAVLMRRYGREVDGRQWESVYRKYLNRGIQLMPYVKEVLEELKKDYRLYVITNGLEDSQVYRMRESGLAAYFLDIFISSRIGANKPSKEYFDYVKNHIPEFDAEKSLVIGDSLTSDIRGGYEAGLDTCWFAGDPDKKPEDIVPTYTIHKLPELLEVLGKG